ncbi:MAG: hypothetical protein AABY11_01255, partial [archaeon]
SVSDRGATYFIWNLPSRTGTLDLNADKSPRDFNVAIFGNASGDGLGFNDIAIGDLDHDGQSNDIAIGAYAADPKSRDAAGAVYVFKDIHLESGIIDLAQQSGRSKVDLNILGSAASDSFGWAQTFFGDADADGYNDDLVVGAQGVDSPQTGSGCVYLIQDVNSKLGSIDLLSPGSAVNLRVCSNTINGAMGYTGNFFIDLDSDGFLDDWVFGRWQGDPAEGLQFIRSAGQEAGNIVDTNVMIDLNIFGATTRQSFCIRTCVFDQANGVGGQDFFLTAGGASPSSRTNAGQLYVFNDINSETLINLANNTGRSKIDLNILGSVASDFFGYGGMALGDLDADGDKETMAIGAYGADPLGRSGAGTMYLFNEFYSMSGIVDLNVSQSDVDHYFYGAVAGDSLGLVTPRFVDIYSGTATNDLVIGATGYDYAGRSASGGIWVYEVSATEVNDPPVVNVHQVDSVSTETNMSPFSYFSDGNLTIDINVMDDSTDLILDLNYADSSTVQGTGTPLVNDLNLAALGTTGAYNCADTDFSNVTRCSIDWNIA